MISTRLVELVIDTVVCLTLAKWETVSGQFGGYLRGGRSFFTRRLVAVTAIDIDVGRAHIAAFHWAVPFIRLGRVCGICSRSNGIGRPTRARGEGRATGIDRRGSAWIGLSAIGLRSSATIGSTGISWRRSVGWGRAVGWLRSVALG